MCIQKIVTIINFIKNSAKNVRLFKELCKNMESEHETLLYYSPIRWLSAGNALNRFFELRNKIKTFLRDKNDFQHYRFIADSELEIVYLVDIFTILNQLNLQLQGNDGNIFTYISGYVDLSVN